MENKNRVYYGEYSLKHWIDLILSKNIVLPEYQRSFVWKELDVKKFMESLSKGEFVPSVTIGSFFRDGKQTNIIIDGQQRLTSVLLAYLEIFPDKNKFAITIKNFANEDDYVDEDKESENDSNIFGWTFDKITRLIKEKDSTKDALTNCIENKEKDKYKNLKIDNIDFEKTYLGFSYIIPNSNNPKEQQKYYSTIFRNINYQGISLDPIESRRALYYLDENLKNLFEPNFAKDIKINNGILDFVRYISLLSQYKNSECNINIVAKYYGRDFEKYYSDYIYSAVSDVESDMFGKFSSQFKDWKNKLAALSSMIKNFDIQKKYDSIIEADLFFFGLIYEICFESKTLKNQEKNKLHEELKQVNEEYKKDNSHTKKPSALKYLRERIQKSIEVYEKYAK